MRYRVQAQYMARRRQFEKSMNRGIDDSTIEAQLMSEFDRDWANWKTRSVLVPGKEVISALNAFLQREHGIAISGAFIIESFRREDVMDEMVELIDAIDDFRRMEVPSE